MKTAIVSGMVQLTAETLAESTALLGVVAPKERAVRGSAKTMKRPYKRQYTRECENGCGKRVKGNLGQAIHNKLKHSPDAPYRG